MAFGDRFSNQVKAPSVSGNGSSFQSLLRLAQETGSRNAQRQRPSPLVAGLSGFIEGKARNEQASERKRVKELLLQTSVAMHEIWAEDRPTDDKIEDMMAVLFKVNGEVAGSPLAKGFVDASLDMFKQIQDREPKALTEAQKGNLEFRGQELELDKKKFELKKLESKNKPKKELKTRLAKKIKALRKDKPSLSLEDAAVTASIELKREDDEVEKIANLREPTPKERTEIIKVINKQLADAKERGEDLAAVKTELRKEIGSKGVNPNAFAVKLG